VKDYLSAVDGIIFLVDAADRTRFQEAQLTLETEETMEIGNSNPERHG